MLLDESGTISIVLLYVPTFTCLSDLHDIRVKSAPYRSNDYGSLPKIRT
jgi:hypothetical protein